MLILGSSHISSFVLLSYNVYPATGLKISSLLCQFFSHAVFLSPLLTPV